MNRIVQRFQDLAARKQAAFIPYITAGDPNLAQTEQLVYALEEAGADVLELGVPFSDPVGDGPVIQVAAQRALAGGTTPNDVLALVSKVRQKSELPILLFTYFNPVFVHGIDNFARDAAAAGADGVLCVDLPPEEAEEYKHALDKNGLCSVFLVAPTTSDKRLAHIASLCTGFVYYVSRLGVTGEQSSLATDLSAAVQRIKRFTDKPVAVGFGVSKPEQAREVADLAEGVVVGSAIVRLIGELGDQPETPEKVRQFAAALAQATKSTAG